MIAKWRFRRLWHKIRYWNHTTIRARTLPRHGPCDYREQLAHIMFEVLSRFIEEECSPGIRDWYSNPYTVTIDGVEKNVRDEMQDLYNWWHEQFLKGYPAEEEKLWEMAEKHAPLANVRQENGKGVWEPVFESTEDKVAYNNIVHSISELEGNRELELQRRLQRLVNLRLYMWT